MDDNSAHPDGERISARALVMACGAWLLGRILVYVLLGVCPCFGTVPELTLLVGLFPLFLALLTAMLFWRPLARRVGWRTLLGLEEPPESTIRRWLWPLVCSLPLVLVGGGLTLCVLKLGSLCHLPEPPPQFPFLAEGEVTPSYLLTLFVLSVGIAPLVEEMLFRALAMRAFAETRTRHPVLLSALLFALMHLLPQGIPTLTVVGLVCAWRFRRGGLWSACALHAMYNFWIFLWFLFCLWH